MLSPWIVAIAFACPYNHFQMSARTCQLCGKPLSRIRVGTDGDFCSREHRNQYRLRQGMGRLQEANKVANVMRRREQLRPLTGIRSANESPGVRRGFFRTKFVPAARPALAIVPVRIDAPPLKVTAHSDHYIPPCPNECTGAPRTSSPISFAPRRRPMLPSQRMAARSVAMQTAPPLEGVAAFGGTKLARRDFGILLPNTRRRPSIRRSLPSPAVKLPGARGSSTGYKSTAARGNALRVSLGCKFRARPQRRLFAPIPGKFDARLRWRERSTRLEMKAPRAETPRLVDAMDIPLGGIYCPVAPALAAPGPQPRRRPISLKRPAAVPGEALAARTGSAEWNPQNFGIAFPDTALPAWKGTLVSRPFVSQKPAAAVGPGASQHLLAPFVPQDVPRGYAFNIGQNGSKDHTR